VVTESLPLLIGVGLGVCLVVLILWAALDAFERTEAGCLWLVLFVTIPFISLPIYLFARFYADRPAMKGLHDERPEGTWVSRFPSDFDKLSYIRQLGQSEGSALAPDNAMRITGRGYKHFTDSRAEALLEQRRFDEALDYLLDLYALAVRAGDARGRDTYLSYISGVPGGTVLLREWEREQLKPQGSADAVDRREPPF
jgi:hypothetical protein